MIALLVHGMGRTPLSMRRLARALRPGGVETRQFGYVAAWQPVSRIVDRLVRRITLVATQDYIVIGHSLGGVLLRMALGDLPAGVRPPRALVLIASPTSSPRLARRFQRHFWYRILNGDAGRLLASEARMSAVPAAAVPVVGIAGTGGPRGRFSPFGDEPNDGMVALDEVALNGAEQFVAVDALHPFVMNHERARALIRERCTTPPASAP